MRAESSNGKELRLPDLSIRGFRGFEELSIPRLGRVTLIVGKNAVGKSSLLDAIRVYVSHNCYVTLANMLFSREEIADDIDEDDFDSFSFNWESLFYNRRITSSTQISIETSDICSRMRIRPVNIENNTLDLEDLSDDSVPSIEIELCSKSLGKFPLVSDGIDRRAARRFRHDHNERLFKATYQTLGPDVISSHQIGHLWDDVALTDDEELAQDALNLVFNGKIRRIGMVGEGGGARPGSGRRAVVRVEGESQPIPLRSLGDGATRLFGVALALARSRDGFLLIDEAENGLHWSVQPDFWRMVVRTAYENNIQVFATTHSWDCVASYAQAVAEIEEVDGAIIRLQRDGGNIRAIEYSERNLRVAAEQGIEVR